MIRHLVSLIKKFTLGLVITVTNSTVDNPLLSNLILASLATRSERSGINHMTPTNKNTFIDSFCDWAKHLELGF